MVPNYATNEPLTAVLDSLPENPVKKCWYFGLVSFGNPPEMENHGKSNMHSLPNVSGLNLHHSLFCLSPVGVLDSSDVLSHGKKITDADN